MNEIKISGILGEVEERTSGNGLRVAITRLSFNAHGDTVLLIAADSRVRQLTAFDTGAHVRVIGRLAVFKDSLAILVDEVGRWLEAKGPAKFHDNAKANRTMRELG